MKLEFCRQILEKCLNTKFELTKLTVVFRNFVNTPKNPPFCPHSVFMCFVWSPKQSDIISELRSIIGSCTGDGALTARCELNL